MRQARVKDGMLGSISIGGAGREVGGSQKRENFREPKKECFREVVVSNVKCYL